MASGLAVAPAAAQGAVSQPTEAELVLDLKALEDPTILKSRAWLEGEWNNDRGNSSSFELTLGIRKGWRISRHQDWGLQVHVPFRSKSTKGADGRDNAFGFFDVRITVGTARHLSDTVRLAGAFELRLPTGDRSVSGNIWRGQEFVVLAWDATPWLTIAPKAMHYHTIARQSGATRQHYWELYLPATFVLPNRWSLTPRYEAKLDRQADQVTHSARLSVNKQLDKPELGLGVSLKMPINQANNQYQIILSVTRPF